MAKGRMLLKRISKSDKLNALSCDTARLLYTWMLAYLDCNGCYHANPVIIKNEVFCIREDISKKQVSGYLDEMENLLLIKRYGNNQYLFYPDFEDKQPKIQKDREGKSEIPEPPNELRKTTHELIMSNSGITHAEYNIKESKAETENAAELFFKCEYFAVHNSDAEKYCAAYNMTHKELLTELRKIEIWNDANPNNRKKNYARHITNWLSRIKKPMPQVPRPDNGSGQAGIKKLLAGVRMRRAKLAAASGGNGSGRTDGHLEDDTGGNNGGEAAGEEIPATEKTL